ncbi:MAG: protein kinase domain-containing protein [Myxococcota bacterium]
MSEPVAPPLPGDFVGPYKLVESVGVGGMAAVYRAEGPKGAVAIKVLHQNRVAAAEEVKRFRREYLTLERLRHPNVVRVYDAGEKSGHPWIAMELVDGVDLGRLLEAWEKDPPVDRFERVERIFEKLCDALAYVHEQGIIHRDLKPGNVLVDKAGIPRLTDFGVVKDPDAFQTNLTLAGRLVGTVAFMAPEQITGETVDARADLYGLGALLYVMLTFRRPIVADSIAGYLARHLTETPRPPSDHDPRVPQRLERICMRLLQKDPARRYASAREVLAALKADAAPEALPIHGRDAVLDALGQHVQALVRRGVGGVVALTGPAGSGRSRLLADVAERARAAGASAALAGAKGTLAAIDAALPQAPEAMGLGGLAAWRARMADRPWVIVVDDLDHTEPDVQRTLGELLREAVAIEGGSLLLVVAARTGAGGPILTGTATGLTPDEIALAGLDRDAVRAMVRDRGLHGALGAALGRRLHEELGGMPGPVLEQLDALVRAGWLVRSPDGALRATRPVDQLRTDPLPVPDRVRKAEAGFLDGLGPRERDVVEALAVLGTPGSATLLAAMTGLGEHDAAQALAALARAGHVTVQEDGLQELFHVDNRRRARVVYEQIEAEKRATLHRAAAAGLQQLFRRRLGTIAEVAAHHLLHGGDPAGAYPLLVQASQRAARRGEWQAARTSAQRALEAASAAEAAMPAGDATRWRKQLQQVVGDAARAQGQVEAAAEAYAEALAAARAEGDRAGVGKALAGAGLVALTRGRATEALTALEEALPALERGDAAWPEAANALALVRYDAGHLAGAQDLWRACVELGQATRSVGAELGGLWGLALLARAERRRVEAIDLLERAIERGPGAADAWMRVVQQRAELMLEEADWAGAARLGDDLDALGDRASSPLATALAAGLRAAALDGMAETAAAARAAREGLQVCRLDRIRVLAAWAWPVRVLGTAAEEAATALAEGGWAPEPPFDTEGLRLALLARATADPLRAADVARAALARPAVAVPAAAARVEVDAGVALVAADPAGAARAFERALLRLDDRHHRALVAEACRRMMVVAPSPGVEARLRRVS